MTKKELADNITFLSAMKLLDSITAQKLLSSDEAERVRAELKRRLRPTLVFA